MRVVGQRDRSDGHQDRQDGRDARTYRTPERPGRVNARSSLQRPVRARSFCEVRAFCLPCPAVCEVCLIFSATVQSCTMVVVTCTDFLTALVEIMMTYHDAVLDPHRKHHMHCSSSSSFHAALKQSRMQVCVLAMDRMPHTSA